MLSHPSFLNILLQTKVQQYNRTHVNMHRKTVYKAKTGFEQVLKINIWYDHRFSNVEVGALGRTIHTS